MGSKKKKNQDPNVSAYGTSMKQSEKNRIDSYNNAEKARGQTLENNFKVQKEAIVKKEGTVDFKKYLKKRADTLMNVLGVGSGK